MRIYVRNDSLARNFTGTVSVTASNGRGSTITFTPLTIDYIVPIAIVTVQETRTVMQEVPVINTVTAAMTLTNSIENVFSPTCSAIPTIVQNADPLPQALSQTEAVLGIFIGGSIFILGLIITIIYLKCKPPTGDKVNENVTKENRPTSWWAPGGEGS